MALGQGVLERPQEGERGVDEHWRGEGTKHGRQSCAGKGAETGSKGYRERLDEPG
jgi:hypothetical protein